MLPPSPWPSPTVPVEMLQEFLADPNKFATAAKEESEEEVDDDMGFGLFD